MSSPYKFHGKRAICFDLNETLIHQSITFEQSFRSVWNDYAGRGLPASTNHADYIWESYQEQWQEQRKAKEAKLSFEHMQEKCLTIAITQAQLPVHIGFVSDFFRLVRKQRLMGKTIAPGVEAVLQALSPNYKLAIVSNSPLHEVMHVWERFALKTYFPEKRIVTAESLTEKKPGFLIFKSALQALELTPRQVVMVGNSWKHDICGATKAGMDAVWLRSPSGPPTTTKISRQKLGKRTVYLIQHIHQIIDLF